MLTDLSQLISKCFDLNFDLNFAHCVALIINTHTQMFMCVCIYTVCQWGYLWFMTNKSQIKLPSTMQRTWMTVSPPSPPPLRPAALTLTLLQTGAPTSGGSANINIRHHNVMCMRHFFPNRNRRGGPLSWKQKHQHFCWMTNIYEWVLVVTTVAEERRWVTAATSLPPYLSYAPLAG